MPERYLLGIDLGTSSLKTVVIKDDGRRVGSASREYAIDSPKTGWAEQDTDTWLSAAVETIGAATDRARLSPERIAAIGISGQMHGLVCLDARGDALRPAIIWADRRSREQVTWLEAKLGKDRLARWTGNPLAPGFMLPSWLWLKKNEPAVARRTARLLLPKDYLRFRITGRIAGEPSDASSTSLFDPRSRKWSEDLLAALQIAPGLLPPIQPSAAIAGSLTEELATATGLRAGTPVVLGGSDQACQALAQGVIDPGVVSSTIGTGGQLLAPTLNAAHDAELRLHLFCHVLPDRWHLEAATLSAGLSLRWLRENFFPGASYQGLADQAAQAPAGSEGLIFLPYLLGERTPHMDPKAPAGWIGLTLRHQPRHLIRAVMEGVVFSLRQGLELIFALGVPVERLVASGGGTAHPLWLQLQADIFNRPVYVSPVKEAAATGAALLAGLGVEVFPDARSASNQVLQQPGRLYEPDPGRAEIYARAYEVYGELYPHLHDIPFKPD